jgi:hypothetical protein
LELPISTLLTPAAQIIVQALKHCLFAGTQVVEKFFRITSANLNASSTSPPLELTYTLYELTFLFFLIKFCSKTNDINLSYLCGYQCAFKGLLADDFSVTKLFTKVT